MYLSARTISRLFFATSLSALAAILTAAAALQPVLAQETHLWSQSRLNEFEKGTPEGVALTSDGHLCAGPSLSELLTTPSTFVWSVAVDKSGTAYAGTSSPATVLRVGRDGKFFTLFKTRDLSMQVVRLGPDGALYAATLPSGKVYRLKADATEMQDESSATVVFDSARQEAGATSDRAGESKPTEKGSGGKSVEEKSVGDKATASAHFIWDLTFDSAGRLYIATGGPGAVYRVDPSKTGAQPELFFKSDEAHIRALAWDAKGNLIAGSDGSGLIYQISPQGKGYVLFEAPRREIAALAVGANGTIYAASVGDKSHNPLPPLPLQGIGATTITIAQPGAPSATNASASLPEGSEIYALAEGQAPRTLWTGKDEIVYALAARLDGLLALTGNRGRVFRIADDGSYADIAHLEAQQGLSMAAVPSQENSGGILIGTGNTGKLVLLGAAEKHEYASDVLDAGALARFGRVEVDPGSTGYEILTRSGNVEQPVRGWSEWQPLKDGAVASPAGRFFEWKALLHTGGSLGSVGVNYLPLNAAPVVDDLVVVTGARVTAQSLSGSQPATVNITFDSSASADRNAAYDSGADTSLTATRDRTAITVRWAAHDDNGDDLIYALYLRGDGETVWRLLKDRIAATAYSFDATRIPDGGYQIKIVASDLPSHTPADALTGARVSSRFVVDTTPPVIADLKTAREETTCAHAPCSMPVRLTFAAEDAASPIARAEYSLDAGPWQFIEPVGELSDSMVEHYNVLLPAAALDPKTGEHLITVRAYDRHDNVGLAKTVIAAQEK
jgi:hypothetical protein